MKLKLCLLFIPKQVNFEGNAIDVKGRLRDNNFLGKKYAIAVPLQRNKVPKLMKVDSLYSQINYITQKLFKAIIIKLVIYCICKLK